MENINTHILCLSEHHMEHHGLLRLISSGYTVGLSFSRKHLQSGGVCIFVRKDMNIKKIDISHNCREKDLEICAVELETEASKLIVLSVIEFLKEILSNSLKKLDDTLKYLYKPTAEFLLCGDINIDYFHENNWEKNIYLPY